MALGSQKHHMASDAALSGILSSTPFVAGPELSLSILLNELTKKERIYITEIIGFFSLLGYYEW